jgi:two-component system phosphate regulon sensor histidine kinase PhoR
VAGAGCVGAGWILLRRSHAEHYALSESLKQLQRKETLQLKLPSGIAGTTLGKTLTSFTEQKQKEVEELRKLEVFRKEFIADISHELKTPLFAAQGFVHTLLDGAVNDKAVRTTFLKKAARSLDGLEAMVHDLLTLSHIETGQTKMHFELIDLYALTEEVIEQFEEKAEKRSISITIESVSRSVTAYADKKRIAQVLTNLISNAINHSPEHSRINIRFSVEGKFVVTHVQDNGEGIAPEHLSRIFERFYRVDKSRSREKGGSGLGLAIVKHILESHGSRADVSSTVGKGSDFSFKLPRSKTEAVPQE